MLMNFSAANIGIKVFVVCILPPPHTCCVRVERSPRDTSVKHRCSESTGLCVSKCESCAGFVC